MFCPVCKAEYQPGITRCPDDDAELVVRLSEEPIHDESEARLVTLHTFGSPIEAEMVNDILRQNNIRSLVQSGSLDAFSPLLSSVTPGASILVDERDHDQALELYQAFFGEDTTPLTGSTGEEGDDEEE